MYNNRQGTMENRLWVLLDVLSEEYKTSKQLGEELGVSEKTVRTRIRELEEAIEGCGALICAIRTRAAFPWIPASGWIICWLCF